MTVYKLDLTPTWSVLISAKNAETLEKDLREAGIFLEVVSAMHVFDSVKSLSILRGVKAMKEAKRA